MIVTKLLQSFENIDDLELQPILRTTEYTIYIKKSLSKRLNETLALDLVNNPTEKDIELFQNYFIDADEYFMTPNGTYDTAQNKPLTNWDYNNDEKNYFASKIQLYLLERLMSHLENDNDDKFSLILMLLFQNPNNENQVALRPFHVFCHPQLALDELNFMTSKLSASKNGSYLLSLLKIYSEDLKKSNENYLNDADQIRTYLKTKVAITIEKAIDIIKEKLSEFN